MSVRVIMICLMLGLVVACDDGAKKGSIRRARGDKNAADAKNTLSDGLLKGRESTSCLPIDKLASIAENRDFVIYSSNFDIGQLEPGSPKNGGDCIRFNPKIDPKTRAMLFVMNRGQAKWSEPFVEFAYGKGLLSSKKVDTALQVTSQSQCESVTFSNSQTPAKILCHTPNMAAVRLPTGDTQVYNLNGNSLIITTYVPVKNNIPTACGATLPADNLVVRATKTITSDDLGRMPINRGFAELFDKYLVEKPNGLTQSLAAKKSDSKTDEKAAKAVGETVTLPYPTIEAMFKAARNEQNLKEIDCSKP